MTVRLLCSVDHKRFVLGSWKQLLCGVFLVIASPMAGQYAAGDYGTTANGPWTSLAIWSTWNGVTWVPAAVLPGAAHKAHVLAGRDVTVPNPGPYSIGDLRVEVGARLWAGAGPNVYLNIYGSSIECDGQIGNGTTFDQLSFNIEGANVTIFGTGQFDCSRIRKDTGTNFTTNLTFAMNVNLRFTSGSTTQIYNNYAGASIFNVTINAGITVNLVGVSGQGNVALDGIDGLAATNRGGHIIVNGALNISGTLYLTTNNTTAAYACRVTINAGGVVRTNTIQASASGAAGHYTTINNGGTLEITGLGNPWLAFSTTNNFYTVGVTSLVEYRAAGAQTVLADIPGGYGQLRISGTGTKTLSNATNVRSDLSIVNTLGSPSLDVSASNFNLFVGGNWTNYNEAGFIERSGMVIFNGNGPQSITTTGGERFNNLRSAKTVGTILSLSSQVEVNNQLSFTNGILDLNGQRLVLLSNAPAAIAGATATRYILAERTDHSSRVQWNIGTAAGPHTIPFGRAGAFLPFAINRTAGDLGLVTVSTYGTGADNLPWPVNPTPVLNLNSVAGLLPDNRDATVDRYWQVDRTGGGSATLTFTYAPSESPAAPYNNPAGLFAQHYDAGVDRWQPATGGQTIGVNSVTVPGTTQSGPWSLASDLSPLPVELLHFHGEPEGNDVRLRWATASERDNSHFIIQRGLSPHELREIFQVDGHGNSQQIVSYDATDQAVPASMLYYRLDQVDLDGSRTSSQVVAVDMRHKTAVAPHLYPNPASDQCWLELVNDGTGPIHLWIHDATGRVVHQWSGLMTDRLALPVSLLLPGRYAVSVDVAGAILRTALMVVR